MQIFWNKELHQSVKPYLLLQKKVVIVWTNIHQEQKEMHSLMLKSSGVLLSYAESDENYKKMYLACYFYFASSDTHMPTLLKMLYTHILF